MPRGHIRLNSSTSAVWPRHSSSVGRQSGLLTLLERLFLLERLPAWHSNRLKRLVKSPNLHLTDTGLAAALLGTDTKAFTADRTLVGRFVETFVYQELRRQASWRDTPTEFFHFRDKDGVETDIVIEQTSGAVAGVEIKVAATVTSTDMRGLRKLEKAVGSRFVRGTWLYDVKPASPSAIDSMPFQCPECGACRKRY